MIVFFDGVCNLCSSSVQFIIKRDKRNIFKFASFQSCIGKKILLDNDYNNSKLDTLVLLNKNIIYTKSTAALKIAKELNGFWKLFYIFIIIPKFLRDPLYSFIAKNRYNWFGKKDSCMLPTPETKKRFLE